MVLHWRTLDMEEREGISPWKDEKAKRWIFPCLRTQEGTGSSYKEEKPIRYWEKRQPFIFTWSSKQQKQWWRSSQNLGARIKRHLAVVGVFRSLGAAQMLCPPLSTSPAVSLDCGGDGLCIAPSYNTIMWCIAAVPAPWFVICWRVWGQPISCSVQLKDGVLPTLLQITLFIFYTGCRTPLVHVLHLHRQPLPTPVMV